MTATVAAIEYHDLLSSLTALGFVVARNQLASARVTASGSRSTIVSKMRA